MTLRGRQTIGFGDAAVALPVRSPSSPWPLAVASSVVAAATGWVIEEVASHVRGKGRRR